VISSVCLSVCLSVCPTGYLQNHAHDLYQIFVHVAYGCGSVLLRQGDEIPGEGAIAEVFLQLTIHCNAFAANNVIQQQNGPFRR